MNRKRKWLIALATAFAMLFSAVGTAAATETAGMDVHPAIIADMESETELHTEADDDTESDADTEADDDTESDADTEANGEEKSDTDAKADDDTESDADTEADGEEKSDTDAKAGDDTGSDADTEEDDDTESDADSKADDDTEADADTEADDDTEADADSELDDDTESDAGTEADDEEKSDADTESDNGPEIKEESNSNPDEETEADNLPENPDEQLTVNPENPDGEPHKVLLSGDHEHSWTLDWSFDENFHWHECDAEDCPVSYISEKDGYAEHSYGDGNVCTECGYYELDSRLLASAARETVPTFQEAYNAMIALQEQYPEGMTWTNFTPYGSNGSLGDSYVWKGGAVYGANRGVGCTAFAFLLSDAAFGSLPARTISRGSFTFEDVKVGDILRVENNSHSVIVLQKSAGGIIIAEANYNKSVHWGRAMSATDVLAANYIITRYPEGYVTPNDPEADKVAQNGTAGDLSWSLTNAGILTVSGNGVIPDYSPNDSVLPPWNGYSVSTVILEKGVTGIGDYAFYQSGALSIYIPDGITKIGQNAFGGSALLSATIPGTVESVGANAFHDCANLTSVTVSEGVKTIGDNAFRGCTKLAYIDFPASITSVGAGAFMSCSEITRVRFIPGTGTVTFGADPFAQCWKLTSVTLPQTADRISAGMFQSCSSLPALYIPASVKEIGENPFTSCKALQYIYFGGSETEWNNIASVYLRASLKSTGTTVIFNAAFDDPFANDPNDPGDFLPDKNESGSCTSHVDANKDGKCDNCGAAMSTDTPGSDDGEKDPAKPDDSEKDPAKPDDSGKDPAKPDDSGKDPVKPDDSGKDPTKPDDGKTDHTPGSSGGSNGNSGSSNGTSSGSENNSGSSGESDRISGTGVPGSQVLQYEYIQNRNEPSNLRSRLASSETLPASEDESPDTESLPQQDQAESETTFDESSESDQTESQETSDEETAPENENENETDQPEDQAENQPDTGILIPVLTVSAAVALGAAFVFMRKKNLVKP